MRSLSQRKLKRLPNKRERSETRMALRKIVLDADTLVDVGTPGLKSRLSNECTETSKSKFNEEYNQEVPGEYVEPNPEIMEVAFAHSPVLTKRDLLDSGINIPLSDLDKTGINDPIEDFLGENYLFQLQYAP